MSAAAQRIEDLTALRDAIEATLGTGADYVELTIRGRTVKRAANIATLDYLNAQIAEAESRVSSARGPARNKARLGRA
mgnify:CR=1 FL=1|tara:strand:+ start:1356 stop:1589 length:234 start_codon:yes stop_codon:yes gene_type:complete